MSIARSNPLPAKSIARRLRDGFGWSMVGNLGWRALTAFSSIVVARILGPVGFGELGILRSTANIFTTLAVFQLGTTANKHLAEYREKDPPRAASILAMVLAVSAALCLVLALVLLAAGRLIATHLLDNPGIGFALQLGSVFMFFQSYSAVRETILVGTERFRSFTLVNLVKGVTTALLMPLGAWLAGVEGAIAGLGLAAVVSFVVLEREVRRALDANGIDRRVPMARWRSQLPILWRFAAPGLATGLITALCYWLGRVYVIGASDGYFQLGLFEAANQWRTIILFIPGSLALVALPIIAESFGKGDKVDIARATSLQFNGILAISLPITVSVIVFADWLILLFGREYDGGAQILPTLMLSVFLFALNQSLRKITDGSGKVWHYLCLMAIWAAAFLIGIWVLWPTPSALGLAHAYALSEGAMVLATAAYVTFRLVPTFLRAAALPLLLSLVTCGLVLTQPGWQWSAVCLALSLVPLALLYREGRR